MGEKKFGQNLSNSQELSQEAYDDAKIAADFALVLDTTNIYTNTINQNLQEAYDANEQVKTTKDLATADTNGRKARANRDALRDIRSTLLGHYEAQASAKKSSDAANVPGAKQVHVKMVNIFVKDVDTWVDKSSVAANNNNRADALGFAGNAKAAAAQAEAEKVLALSP
jgi:hypothetical protein